MNMESQDQIDDLIRRLSMIPSRIARAVETMPGAEKRRALSADEWSASQILAHLRASNDIVAYRLYAILARDTTPLPAYDERRWAKVAGYEDADFESSLQIFTLCRAELVAVLQKIDIADWQRFGIHEEKGVLSLFEVATSLVEHEEEHCQQLENIYT